MTLSALDSSTATAQLKTTTPSSVDATASTTASTAAAAKTTTATTAKSSLEVEDKVSLSPSFNKFVSNQTRGFATKLSEALTSAGVSADTKFSLTLGPGGKIEASGPAKEQIEKAFADDPKMAQTYKTIMALNMLLAQQEANRAYREQSAKATTKQDWASVQKEQISRLLLVQKNSSSLSFDNRNITSVGIMGYKPLVSAEAAKE